MIDNRYGGDKT